MPSLAMKAARLLEIRCMDLAAEVDKLKSERDDLKKSSHYTQTCATTGLVAGHPQSCGDCDPCSAGRGNPESVKRLLKECESLWAERDALLADKRRAISAEYKDLHTPRPRSEWHDDIGPVLWWDMPVSGEPYVGSPLDTCWNNSYDNLFTHWSPLPCGEEINANYAAIKGAA